MSNNNDRLALIPEGAVSALQILAARQHDLQTVADIATPDEYIKQPEEAGYYPFPEFAWMLSLMNKYHRFRKEEGEFERVLEARVIVAKVTVTDILTGEVRTGVDAHRITFKKGMPASIENVVDIGNDYKSAMTEALRKAYSGFEVCADMYKRKLSEPPTDEQIAKWEACVEEWNFIASNIHDIAKGQKLTAWWEDMKAAWSTKSSESAPKFLRTLSTHLGSLKGKLIVIQETNKET